MQRYKCSNKFVLLLRIMSFYYYLKKIINKDYDIIICERDYFFDNKTNISIRKVIDFDNKDNANKYLFVFDEYNDIDTI